MLRLFKENWSENEQKPRGEKQFSCIFYGVLSSNLRPFTLFVGVPIMFTTLSTQKDSIW